MSCSLLETRDWSFREMSSTHADLNLFVEVIVQGMEVNGFQG